jgi:hypothetical protein
MSKYFTVNKRGLVEILHPENMEPENMEPESTPVPSDETESEDELLDPDIWFEWYKSTHGYNSSHEYKIELAIPVLSRSTNLMGNTGKQEPEPEGDLPEPLI